MTRVLWCAAEKLDAIYGSVILGVLGFHLRNNTCSLPITLLALLITFNINIYFTCQILKIYAKLLVVTLIWKA